MLEHVQQPPESSLWDKGRPGGRGVTMDSNRGTARRVSQFAESDYCYGTGTLTIKVERVDWSRPVLYDGENWYEVEGVEVAVDGRELGRRQALVRGRRLNGPPGRRA
ncbi:hypothetical protein Adi01nite_24300 [Amorphoplanes digitatis]|nr:hypothetical protein Adi01nite_24300 [Actinoplanes digitatis]